MAADQTLGQFLRSRGHRLTGPRRAVWEVLHSAGEHLTAGQITQRARRAHPEVNRASVYRSLALFAELGLARESNLGMGEASRWETAHLDDQFHLVCECCGRIGHHAGDLVERVRSHLSGEHGFRARRVELHVSGLCGACQTAGA